MAHVPYWGPPLLPRVPTVVTVHDVIPLLLPAYASSLPARAYVRLVSAAARRATLVITDSRASARDIVRHLHIPAERVRPIYLAADPRFRPAPPEDQQRVRNRFGLSGDYLVYLGGFDRRKRVETLIRAFAAMAVEFPGVSLVVAGRFPEKDTAIAPDPRPLTAALCLGERVRFIGWVDEEDKPALYSGALAMAFPSEYEGFGLGPLEALASGCPVIAANTSSLPEVVRDGGILIDLSTPDDLARAVARVVGDSSLRAELRARALAQAARFSWTETARQTVRVYEEAAEGVAQVRVRS
jgi:glycosyltransferase involved in cell wall biosynthesis